MISVFDIKQEYRALEDLANETDPETGEFLNNEEQIKDLLDELNDTREQKLESIEYLKREIKGKIDTVKEEVTRLTNKRKSFEKTIERLKELQDTLLNGEKLKTDKFTFSYRTSKRIEADDEQMPLFYDTPLVKRKFEWDKTAIKEYMKNNKNSVFSLVEKKSLSVR